MTKNNSKDLTVGSPTWLILGFSLPLLLGMLFQQVYSLMDTIIVGRFSKCFGLSRSRLYRKHLLSHHRLLPGCVCRLFTSNSTALWCQG